MAKTLPNKTKELKPAEIVHGIQNGEAAAENALYSRYARGLQTMLRQRTGDHALAEDLAHDAIRVVLERLRDRGLDEPGKLSAFVHRTAVNLHIGEIRRTTRRGTYPDSDRIAMEPDSRQEPLAQLLRDESGSAVRAAIKDLTVARDREIIRRFYILEEDKSTICVTLDLSVRHFDRVISRAKKRFLEEVLKNHKPLLDIGGRIR